MTPDTATDAPTGAFSELPYTVTVQAASSIGSVLKVLESGGYAGHVTAARVEGALYPIDGLEVLSAHRESGRAAVPCVVVDAGSLAEAQLLHVRQSAHGQVNPVVFADAVSFVRRHMGDGPATGIDNWEYRKIAEMRLAPEIMERMSEYITGIGKKTGRIPSFLSLFQAVSGTEPGRRAETLDRLIRCCDLTAEYNGFYTVPDLPALKRVIGLLTPRKRRGEPTDGDAAGMDAWMNGEPGYYHDPHFNKIYFRCGCMSERAIDTKSLTVQKQRHTDRAIFLEGDDGMLMYPIRDDAVEYLNLAAGPAVYCYPLSEGEHGDDMLISKRRLPDDVVERARRAIQSQGSDSESERSYELW